MRPVYLIPIITLISLTACDERHVSTDTGAPPTDLLTDTSDQQVPADGPQTPDKAVVKPDSKVIPDKAAPTDVSTCHCKAPQVWLRSACVPTEKLGCGPTCTPGSCAKNETCDTCAAAPSCMASSCRPACVPTMAMGFGGGSLRVSPTQGVAGKAVTLTVTGGAFYIGAMWWTMNLGSIEANVQHKGTCTVTATFVPPKPGLYPVEVRYKNGSKPALAGFYLASGGSIPPPTAQPGYPCSASLKCAQAKPFSCSCVKGRCKCTK